MFRENNPFRTGLSRIGRRGRLLKIRSLYGAGVAFGYARFVLFQNVKTLSASMDSS